MARNRLYCAVSVFGLAIGLCAALLAALYVRNEMTHDRFIPGYERTYLAITAGGPVDQAYSYDLQSTVRLAPILKLKFNELAVTRLARQSLKLRAGANEFQETAYSADPNVFDVLPLATVAGDLHAALRAPDGIVIPRSIARKYFGRDAPLGEHLLLDGAHVVIVAAVVEDPPANGTELESGIFISGLAPYSALARFVAEYGNASSAPNFLVNVRTYLRVAPGESIEPVRAAIPGIAKLEWLGIPPIAKLSAELVRIDRVHLFAPLNPGINGRLTLAAVIGALILFIACVNFVNLLTAQSTQRAKEVGVRKMAGASRPMLIAQFLGESAIYVIAAMVLGLALAEWLSPYAGAFFDAHVAVDLSPSLILWIASGSVVLTVLVGLYPALVLSSFRPTSVLSGLSSWGSANRLRQALVTLQFAILIGLVVAAGVVHQQRQYAIRDALRMNTDQVLIIRAACGAPLMSGLRALPGVGSAACSGPQLLGGDYVAHFIRPDGSLLTFHVVPIELGLFDLYGLKPLAGALPGQINVFPRNASGYVGNAPYILNETAARLMGFAAPREAVGKTIATRSFGGPLESNLIPAVVPDFSLGSVEQKIEPTAYVVDPLGFGLISVKLRAGDLVTTLAKIDGLGASTGDGKRNDRFFLNDHIERLYLSLLRETQAFGVFSAVAVVLACLGLLALSASMARRRTRELGIRKAMGAQAADVARLLMWQFARPVLLANLVAWPVAGFVMHRWLQGFAYHANLDPRLFLMAGAITLFVAVLTVMGQSLRVARASAAQALRYQ